VKQRCSFGFESRHSDQRIQTASRQSVFFYYSTNLFHRAMHFDVFNDGVIQRNQCRRQQQATHNVGKPMHPGYEPSNHSRRNEQDCGNIHSQA